MRSSRYSGYTEIFKSYIRIPGTPEHLGIKMVMKPETERAATEIRGKQERKSGRATKSVDKGLQVTTGYNTGVVRM